MVKFLLNNTFETAKIMTSNNLILQTWEMGWIETVGPTFIQNLTQATSRILYATAVLNYKILLTLLFLASLAVVLFV